MTHRATKPTKETHTQLIGNNNEALAYIQDGYPFGFRHTTERKYWIESKPKNGQRLVTRLKHAIKGTWFKPQLGIYSPVIVLLLNKENGHIETDGVSTWATNEELDAFAAMWQLDEFQKIQIDILKKKNKIYAEVFKGQNESIKA